MSAIVHRTDTAINIANVVLGGILVIAPWLLGFRNETWASWNAWLSGGVVVLLALLAVVRINDWEEWLNVFAGLWIVGSPWLLFFDDVISARWSHVIIGGCIIAMAAVELRRLYLAPADMTARRR